MSLSSFEQHIQTCLHELRDRQEQKRQHIQSLCGTNYESFLAVVTNMLDGKESASKLRSTLIKLSSRVESSGNDVVSLCHQMVLIRRSHLNIALTMQSIRAMHAALTIFSSAVEAFNSKQYLLTVTKLCQLHEVLLPRIENSFIASKLEVLVPSLVQQLQQKLMSDFHVWLTDSRTQYAEIGRLVVTLSTEPSEEKSLYLNSLLDSLIKVPSMVVKVFDALGQSSSFRNTFKHMRKVSVESIVSFGNVGRKSVMTSLDHHVYNVIGVLTLSVSLSKQVPELKSWIDLDFEWSLALNPVTDLFRKCFSEVSSRDCGNFKKVQDAFKALFCGASVLGLSHAPLIDCVSSTLSEKGSKQISQYFKEFENSGCQFFMIDKDTDTEILELVTEKRRDQFLVFQNNTSDRDSAFFTFSPVVPKIIQSIELLIDWFYDCVFDCEREENDFDFSQSIHQLVTKVLTVGYSEPLQLFIKKLHVTESSTVNNSRHPKQRDDSEKFFKTLMGAVDLFVLAEYFPNFRDSCSLVKKGSLSRAEFSLQKFKNISLEFLSLASRGIAQYLEPRFLHIADELDLSNGEVSSKVYEQVSDILKQFLSPAFYFPEVLAVSYIKQLAPALWKQLFSAFLVKLKTKTIHQQLLPNLKSLLSEFHRYSLTFLPPNCKHKFKIEALHSSWSTLSTASAIVVAENPYAVGKMSLLPSTDLRLLLKMMDSVKLQNKKRRQNLEELKGFIKESM
ncbi:hypothetical protein P9112_004786 [Eukaryota sp. TZLM1-RC]